MIDDTTLPESYAPSEVAQEPILEHKQEQVQTNELHQAQAFNQEPARRSKEHNFAAIRAKMEQLERERDEALRKLEEADESDINLGPDDIAEGKHLSKVQKEIKRLKQEVAAYKTQTLQATTEARLKATYTDFDSVVNSATVEALRSQYPELAATLSTAPDLYSQAVSAYTMIKNLGIVPEGAYNPEKQRIATNVAKPRPSNAVAPQHGESPLSRANAFAEGLTPELEKQLLKEMNQARRGY